MKQKWVKRIARAMLPCFVFFVFSFSFAPKAHAAEVNSNVTYCLQRIYINGQTGSLDTYNFRPKTGTLPLSGVSSELTGLSAGDYGDIYLWLDGNVSFTGPVKAYVSYYFTGYASGFSSNYFEKNGFTIRYTNSFSQTGYVTSLDDIYTFDNSGAVGGKGVHLEASFSASEAMPISGLAIYRGAKPAGILATGGNCQVHYTSVRFIGSAYSEELEALDKVADEIAAQSDILLAMKGDLVAILQDIYTMTGDIYAAQNLLNTYIAQMLPLLENINEITTDIYSLLSTQLRLLETAIENAADSIEAAISAQTAAMIAYLESVLNTGNEVPDDTYQQQQDAANLLDQMESLEKPNVDTIVPAIGDYTDSGVSGVLSAIFSSNLIVTMMTLSASFAFGAYVLFGKRE